MQLDGRELAGEELELHVAAKGHPDSGTRDVLVRLATFLSRSLQPFTEPEQALAPVIEKREERGAS